MNKGLLRRIIRLREQGLNDVEISKQLGMMSAGQLRRVEFKAREWAKSHPSDEEVAQLDMDEEYQQVMEALGYKE